MKNEKEPFSEEFDRHAYNHPQITFSDDGQTTMVVYHPLHMLKILSSLFFEKNQISEWLYLA